MVAGHRIYDAGGKKTNTHNAAEKQWKLLILSRLAAL